MKHIIVSNREKKIINKGSNQDIGMILTKGLQDIGNGKAKNENRQGVSLMNSFREPEYKGIASDRALESHFGILRK